MKTRLLKVDKWNPQESLLEEAAEVIRKGGLVAFPTETVYGLGANALDEKAVLSIFRAKNRPADNPLIVHVSRTEDVDQLAHLNHIALRLMERFWPGPLTLVLPAKGRVPKVTTGGLDTVAVRMPDHPVALGLIEKSQVPIAAPSANLSGRPSPTDGESVMEDMEGRVEVVLDSGPTEVGVESTVLYVKDKETVLLRPGGCPLEALEEIVPVLVPSEKDSSTKHSPGTRYRHYAPSVPVVIMDELGTWREHPAYLGSCSNVGFVGLHNPPFNVEREIIFDSVLHYGRGLFAALRAMERWKVGVILVELPPEEGIGKAVRDRLIRAASG
ncbi:MAG: L-threonylcarbamoyladenylate synthase [Thermovirga sp.]|jgi:L-threonylcarbamoyladenylate synthase|nr:L-threonylcarbamoyladenylate synthase [Thermovirga sp.]MDN5367564.1 L-threonylcarbamoyladenylate synthase [Thermovirga sp.]